MNLPATSTANYVVQNLPELINPGEGQTFKPFYLISAINDRDSKDSKVLRISKKLFDKAGLDKLSPSDWGNDNNPVVLFCTVEERLEGVTQYKDSKGEVKTHTSSGHSVSDVRKGSRTVTLQEKLKYGLFKAAPVVVEDED